MATAKLANRSLRRLPDAPARSKEVEAPGLFRYSEYRLTVNNPQAAVFTIV
jgi:hypothetical protein